MNLEAENKIFESELVTHTEELQEETFVYHFDKLKSIIQYPL
jgi:hypothetical protein